MKHLHVSGRTLRSVAVVVLAAVVLLAVLPGAVYAQGPAPAPRLPALGTAIDGMLARMYQREQTMLTQQDRNLERPSQAVARVQQLLDTAKANGKDVAALEAALATFNGELVKAQAAHDKASGILSTHAGFGDDGKVTDRQAARQTVVQGRQSLLEAHRTLFKALRGLRQAALQWRQAHRPQTPAAAS